MQRLHRYLGSLLVGAALIAPVGIQAKERRIETAPTTDTTTATIRIAIIGTTTKPVPTNPGRRLSTKHIGNSPS